MESPVLATKNHQDLFPSDDMFVYDRKNPPLFFASPNRKEAKIWSYSMQNVTREYFKLSRKYEISASVPLSNGATAGEYGMWLLLTNHEKRKM
jgi:hypothetical protein|eukprot:COSAG01_NODE_12367_length_1752_cov_1.408953_3_plen_93_part_00